MKLMIVDDEAYEREILAGILENSFGAQAQLRTVENGRKAVELAALWNADVILMDIEMPGVNGLEAARQIRESQPGCKILFVTAYPLFDYAREAVKLGACDYILKPVDPEEVVRSVQRAMGQSLARQQLAATASDMARNPAQDKTALLMEQVQKHLQQNYMYDLSLDSVSELVHMSSSYFSALFKRFFGVNFVDYLTELRMQAARELLTDPLRSTAEVSALVGYESPNYFARAFKKKTGMTPTEYRRSAIRREVPPL